MVMKKAASKSASTDMAGAMMCGPWNTKKCIIWSVVTIVVAFGISFLAAKCAVEGMEVMRAGGQENYKMIKELYKSDAWKQTQAMQIQQTMQALQSQGAANGAAVMPAQQATPEAKK